MRIQELLVPELQHEVMLTEKFLKRIPEDKLGWKPHNKSMSLLELGNHLAEIPGWITGAMEMEEMNMDSYESPKLKSVEELIATLKKNASEAQESLKKEDSEYQKNWKMIVGGETVMDMPRIEVLRTMVLNQLPHHRAQMGVYFRLLDIPVPSTYGPSADEN
ncbi:DinB family protein [Gillisia sp. Q332]|uniref:DinB family protein n=1 Tax=Gillisia xinjiangensis TaxID=3384765 RepID=UPI00391DF316